MINVAERMVRGMLAHASVQRMSRRFGGFAEMS